MSLKEKKAWKLTFNIYVYCDWYYANRLHARIKKYIEKIIAMKKLIRLSSGWTDKLI